MAIRMLNSYEAGKKLSEELLSVFKIYEDLRCVYGVLKRRKLDTCWRSYRGDHEDFMPLFGHVSVTRSETSTTVTSREFTKEEILANIDGLLKCVRY